jgi:hypothetical protein
VHQRNLKKREALKLRTALRGINAQDEFAKWAKCRRRMDAAISDYDTLSTFSYVGVTGRSKHGDAETDNVHSNS